MDPIQDAQQKALRQLRSVGLFATVSGYTDRGELIVDCNIYRRRNPVTGVVTLICGDVSYGGDCAVCGQEGRIGARWHMNTSCPLCARSASVDHLTSEHRRGIFKLRPGHPAELLPPPPKMWGTSMVGEPMAEKIAVALTF